MRSIPFWLACVLFAPTVQGQGVMEPLTIHGMDQFENAAVRARGMGGAYAAASGSAESALLNPAALATLGRASVVVSGQRSSRKWAETQHWNPNRYYAGMSLYFADPDDYRSEPLSLPDWEHAQNDISLSTVGAAIPFVLTGRSAGFGITLHQVANMGSFDRNDNVLDPYIGQFRPSPIARPQPGQEIIVNWSSFERERSGTLHAVTAAAGIQLSPRLHAGLRVSRSSGSSNDQQRLQTNGRFILREDAHDYDYEALSGHRNWSGAADYTGWSYGVGVRWTHNVLNVGFVYQAPSTVTQKFTRAGTVADQNDGKTSFSSAGSSLVRLPARIVLGVMVQPAESIRIAADYAHQNYESLEVSGATQDGLPDWGLTRGVNIGMEWQPLGGVHIRTGLRRDPQAFRVEGFGLVGKPAAGDAYSAGVSLELPVITLDVAYELQRLRYQDRWGSNVDYNQIRQHVVQVGATYNL